MVKQVLILSLCRKGGGFEHYTDNVLRHFTLPYTIYQSSYINKEGKIKGAKSIPTYRGEISFIFNSIFLLPLLLVHFFFLSKHYSMLYLPHFHFWNLPFMLLFRLLKKPVIYTEHDGVVHFGDIRFQQPLINLCLKVATHIVFLTHHVKSLVPQNLLRHKHITIIPHGIFDLTGLHNAPKTCKPMPTLLFFGRVSKYKGIELLLEAIQQVPLASFKKLVIAGKSSYTYNTSHLSKGLLAKLEIIDEFLPQKRIVDLFNNADILLMPYLEASQSGVAAIAIANAMPTVCTKVGGLAEQFILNSSLATRGGGGQNEICHTTQACAVFAEPNVASFTNMLLSLLADSSLYESLSHNATIRAKELRWRNITAQIEEFLKKS